MAEAIEWFFAVVVAGVVVSLVSNQIEAWLPLLAREIIRRQARRMGSRANRCEEEWLAHLSETRGGLAQLWFAFGIVFVRFRTEIEIARDAPGGLRQHVVNRVVERAWLLPVIALAFLFLRFPPDRSHYAAYGVLVPFFLLCLLYLASPFREALRQGYERLNYLAQVGAGGLVVPIVGYLALLLSLIPQSPTERPRTAALDYAVPDEPMVVLIATVPHVDKLTARIPGDVNRLRRSHIERPASRFARTSHEAQELTKVRQAASLDHLDRSKLLLRSARRTVGLESLDLSLLPAIAIPEQPLPSHQTVPPVAPSNVRIIQ